MIDDRSKEFMTVRKIAKEYENVKININNFSNSEMTIKHFNILPPEQVTRNLDRNSPSFPPQGIQEEMKQKQYWKKYIQWEKSNPLKSEDNALVAKRGNQIMVTH